MPEKLLVDLDGIDYNKGNLSAAVEENLLGIFKNLFAYHMQLDSRLEAEGFKSRVMNVFKAWEEWATRRTFCLGCSTPSWELRFARLLKGIADTDSSTPVLKHDIYNDGMLLNTTEDIDGVPMQSSEE
ncbi:hypothetical protein quinque_001977 [Culex quinquefasciatus]